MVVALVAVADGVGDGLFVAVAVAEALALACALFVAVADFVAVGAALFVAVADFVAAGDVVVAGCAVAPVVPPSDPSDELDDVDPRLGGVMARTAPSPLIVPPAINNALFIALPSLDYL